MEKCWGKQHVVTFGVWDDILGEAEQKRRTIGKIYQEMRTREERNRFVGWLGGGCLRVKKNKTKPKKGSLPGEGIFKRINPSTPNVDSGATGLPGPGRKRG